MKKIKIAIILLVYSFFFTNSLNSIENKILFKVNNEIISSLDIFNELKYLEIINEQFKNTDDSKAFDIASKSLIRERIKEIELRKVVDEIKIEDEFLENFLINYFKKININSISDFENYFNVIGINPDLIKKKISIEILWNQLIFSKYSQRVKIDKQNIINNLKKNINKKQYLLSEILFNVNKEESLDNKFNQIKNTISASNFSEAALIYSVSDTVKNGGEIGWVNESALSQKIKSVLLNTDKGNHTNPILIPGGFLILKINDVRSVENDLDQDKEIKKIIKEKTNQQLNQFSNIFYNKVKKNVTINEL